MQPQDGKTTPAGQSGQPDWPDIEIPADDPALASTLAEVERRLGGWAEVLEAQCKERQSSLDARQAELDDRERQLQAGEVRLDEHQAGQNAPELIEVVDDRAADEASSEADAKPTPDERTLPLPGGEVQSEARDADGERPEEEAGSTEPAMPQPSTAPTRGPETGSQVHVAEESPPLSDDRVSVTPPAAGGLAVDVPAATESGADVSDTGEVAPMDLDPKAARKLRVLRRLCPGKSDAELLAQLSAREAQPDVQEKTKKRWWNRGR
jgi:hypothetical protein